MIHLLIVLAMLGFVGWILCQIPMAQPIKNIIVGVICIVAVIYVLQALGVNTGFGTVNLR